MFLITNKEDIIINFGEELDYLPENNYPRLIKENISFPPEMINIYEIKSIPENIESNMFCYNLEKGFFENSNYTINNKWNLPNSIVKEIQDETIANLISIGAL